MLGWIRRKLIERSRKLFIFWDGRRFVRRDPMALLRRLSTTELFSPDEDLKFLQIPDKRVVNKKVGQIAEGVREAFEIPEFEDGGLTELECVQVLLKFYAEMNALKKNGEVNPIFSPSTVPQPKSEDSAEKSSTNDESASPSTPVESFS